MAHRAVQWSLHAGSRLKRGVHRLTAPRTPVSDPDANQQDRRVDEVMQLLFPLGVAESSRATVRETLAAGELNATSIRRALGAVDQQTSPTPFSVRLSAIDVAFVNVGGIDVALDSADQSVSAPIIATGEWEPQVVHVLRRHLSVGSVFVDIGANVGWHSAVASSIVGPTGAVFAIEPNPSNARLIAHTIERNGLTNMTLLPFALSSHMGFASFRSAIGSNGGFTNHHDTNVIDPSVTIVPTVRFDDLGVGRVDVVKIDVEGAEPIVLRGAVEMLMRDHPVIVFEFSCEMTQRVGGVDPLEHLRFFTNLGYSLSIIERRDGSQIPVDDVEQLLVEWGNPLRIEDFVAVYRS